MNAPRPLPRLDQQLARVLASGNLGKAQEFQGLLLGAPDKGQSGKEALLKSGLVKELGYQKALAEVLGLELVERLPEAEPGLKDLFTDKVGIRFAKAHHIYPLTLENQRLTLAVVSPWPLQTYDEVAKALGAQGLTLALCPKEEILGAINKSFDKNQSSAEEAAEVLEGDSDLNYLKEWSKDETEDLLDAEDEEPIKKLMNSILFQAVKDKSSDIHIDPGFNETQVRYRIDGVLRPVTKVPKQGQVPLINRVKVMAGLDISTKNKPQDGRSMILLAGKKIDIRVSIIPTVHGEQAVLRILNQSLGIIALERLGFSHEMAATLERLVTRPHGILLVTGPTGSGKTTTLYSLLAKIDAAQKNIVTIEDPVEYRISEYGQMQVNEKTGVTFAKGLRAMLRQDPDVIMVGEMRDPDTAQTAIQASLTGHLVLSTLHTNDAPSSVIRLVDMGIEPFLVSSTLTAVVAQRLVRVLCPSCKTQVSIPKVQLEHLGFDQVQLDCYQGRLWHAEGCPACQNSGYQGRLGIYELLILDEPIRRAISKGADSSTLRQLAEASGMKEMRHDCAQKVLDGLTSLEEMMRVVSSPENEI